MLRCPLRQGRTKVYIGARAPLISISGIAGSPLRQFRVSISGISLCPLRQGRTQVLSNWAIFFGSLANLACARARGRPMASPRPHSAERGWLSYIGSVFGPLPNLKTRRGSVGENRPHVSPSSHQRKALSRAGMFCGIWAGVSPRSVAGRWASCEHCVRTPPGGPHTWQHVGVAQ